MMIVVLILVQIAMAALFGFAVGGGILLAIPAFIALLITLGSGVAVVIGTRRPRVAARQGERAELQAGMAHHAA